LFSFLYLRIQYLNFTAINVKFEFFEFQEDTPTGNYMKSSVSHPAVSAPVTSAPAVTAVPVATAAPLIASLKRTAEEFLSPLKDESKENSGKVSKSSVKPKTKERTMRPFVRTHRPPMDTVSSLLQELVAGQERHASKALHYDRAVKIFHERFRFQDKKW
jgi:hypothetical protein